MKINIIRAERICLLKLRTRSTHHTRYFTRRLPATLLRVTVNAKFLDFKLNKRTLF